MNVKLLTAFVAIAMTLFLEGCSNGYHVLLAIDSKKYNPNLTWQDIRDIGYDPAYRYYTLKIFDNNGHAIQLYRYAHEENRIIPLDETEIHISTPIIIDRTNQIILLEVFDHGNKLLQTSVSVNTLKSAKGGDKVLVVPLDLSAGNDKSSIQNGKL
jgi:hypothetical protein